MHAESRYPALSCGRHSDEGRSREHGSQPGSSRALSRSARSRIRSLFAVALQAARLYFKIYPQARGAWTSAIVCFAARQERFRRAIREVAEGRAASAGARSAFARTAASRTFVQSGLRNEAAGRARTWLGK